MNICKFYFLFLFFFCYKVFSTHISIAAASRKILSLYLKDSVHCKIISISILIVLKSIFLHEDYYWTIGIAMIITIVITFFSFVVFSIFIFWRHFFAKIFSTFTFFLFNYLYRLKWPVWVYFLNYFICLWMLEIIYFEFSIEISVSAAYIDMWTI